MIFEKTQRPHCPMCGGAQRDDLPTGTATCEHCDREFSVERHIAVVWRFPLLAWSTRPVP